MSEIKFEYLIGDENKFKDASEIVLAIIQYGKDDFVYLTEIADVPTVEGNLIALRRIIRTPTWTAEDQKAGRLPEVGAKYMGRDVILECVLADKNGDVWGKSDEGLMHCHSSLDINPIETPEEKTARLKDEWGARATELFMRSDNDAAFDFIYDALLSGELPVPVKDGE